jgi:hypothetical protein
MKTLKWIFWNIYYRLMDKDFHEKLSKVKRLDNTIRQSTRGNLSSFYNVNGEQIRGFHERSFYYNSHPLIEKYGKN